MRRCLPVLLLLLLAAPATAGDLTLSGRIVTERGKDGLRRDFLKTADGKRYLLVATPLARYEYDGLRDRDVDVRGTSELGFAHTVGDPGAIEGRVRVLRTTPRR